MLTTEALVAERPKKKAPAAGGHAHGGAGGMGGDEDF
jgi:chaperonin GroEL